MPSLGSMRPCDSGASLAPAAEQLLVMFHGKVAPSAVGGDERLEYTGGEQDNEKRGNGNGKR